MICSACQWENISEARTCARCRTALAPHCPACGASVGPEQAFCGNCGKRLTGIEGTTDRSPEAYTPGFIAQKILTSRAAMEGERKQVTVLFCDISGSSELARQVGDEAMHRLLNDFFDRALTEIHASEGTLNQFLGDGFMALFGAPIAHEDHARRAASTALAIQRACHAAQVDLTGGRLPLRFGLNTGPVVVGKIGDNLRMDYTAIGDTTNMAARMQQIAASGEILMTETTHEAIVHQFECDRLGERKVKGKDQPIAVFRLRDARANASGEVAHVQRRVFPLVGRQQELATLNECMRDMTRGIGGIVGVIGEPGLGKSRLILEWRRQHESEVLWLEGHALSFGRNLSYAPFISLLRTASAIDERNGQDAAWMGLESFLEATLGEDSTAVLPFIGMLMGLELPAVARGLVSRLEPADVRANVFAAARRLFEVLPRARPVVLELEDWHWADEASTALLDHLLTLVHQVPLLIIVVGRPEPGSPCVRMHEFAAQNYPERYREILMGPLSNSDANRMVDNVLNLGSLPPTVRGLILRKAEGNPLFIEEVARSLMAAGKLTTDPVTGERRLRGDPESIELPDSIESLIMARIDRLEAEVKEVVRLAAVIGRSFYRRILTMLNDAGMQIDRDLAQLQEIDLIWARRVEPELEYMFKHALVHEASYRSILLERRRELHKRVADAIETVFADRSDEFAGVMAHHYVLAQDWPKAQKYLMRAGDQAARMAADTEALAHFREAIRSYAQTPGNKWNPVDRASLDRKIGEALFRMTQYDLAAEHFLSALSALGEHHPRTRMDVNVRIVGQVLQQAWHRLMRRGDNGVGAEPSPADQERVLAVVALSWVDLFRDQKRFFLDVLTALNWAERRGLRVLAATAATGIAISLLAVHRVNLAERYHDMALRRAALTNDEVTRATASGGYAMHLINTGDWPRAVSELRDTIRICRSHGRWRERVLYSDALGWLLIQRGEIAAAREIIAGFLSDLNESGGGYGYDFRFAMHIRLRWEDGEGGDTVETMDRLVDSAQAAPDYQMTCAYLGERVQMALRANDLEAAERGLERARGIVRTHAIMPHLETLFHEAAARYTLKRFALAGPLGRGVALRAAQEAVHQLRHLSKVCAYARPIAHSAGASLAWLTGDAEKANTLWEMGVRSARELAATYHVGLIQYEMGCMKGEASPLEQALEVFTACDLRVLSAMASEQLRVMHEGRDG